MDLRLVGIIQLFNVETSHHHQRSFQELIQIMQNAAPLLYS